MSRELELVSQHTPRLAQEPGGADVGMSINKQSWGRLVPRCLSRHQTMGSLANSAIVTT